MLTCGGSFSESFFEGLRDNKESEIRITNHLQSLEGFERIKHYIFANHVLSTVNNHPMRSKEYFDEEMKGMGENRQRSVKMALSWNYIGVFNPYIDSETEGPGFMHNNVGFLERVYNGGFDLRYYFNFQVVDFDKFGIKEARQKTEMHFFEIEINREFVSEIKHRVEDIDGTIIEPTISLPCQPVAEMWPIELSKGL